MLRRRVLPLLGVLAAVVAGCAFLYVIDWDFLSSQFTAYRVVCEAVVVCNECSQPGMAGNATTYKVLIGQESVIEKGNPATEYTKCAITSRTDWKCSFNDVGLIRSGGRVDYAA